MSLARLVAAVALTFAVSAGTSAAQLNTDGSLTRFDATLYRLGIKLPPRVVDGAAVNKALDQLNREKCDQSAIADLGKACKRRVTGGRPRPRWSVSPTTAAGTRPRSGARSTSSWA